MKLEYAEFTIESLETPRNSTYQILKLKFAPHASNGTILIYKHGTLRLDYQQYDYLFAINFN